MVDISTLFSFAITWAISSALIGIVSWAIAMSDETDIEKVKKNATYIIQVLSIILGLAIAFGFYLIETYS